jgi:hypothetical protein
LTLQQFIRPKSTQEQSSIGSLFLIPFEVLLSLVKEILFLLQHKSELLVFFGDGCPTPSHIEITLFFKTVHVRSSQSLGVREHKSLCQRDQNKQENRERFANSAFSTSKGF